MGFYGNITNTSKTQFQFDRIYSSRSAMENKMYTDNIYAGRYVLVEYDSTPELGAFSRVYIRGSYAYKSPNFEATTRITKAEVKLGTIVYTASNLKEDSALVPSECIFYVCTTDRVEGSTEPALWKEVIESTNSYTINYNIDTAAYGPSRGYDSTVWQKAYIDGLEKYVQIAELNSVIPTFDIAADAPTMEPITPHFDVNSTNVYYKLHTQPQWGLRVKEKENNVTLSENVEVYPSDVRSKYTKITYNPTTGSQTGNTVEYDGAIYYNKAGFDKNIRTHNDELDGQDIIQIEPTGLSGNKYNIHGSSKTKEQVDIQELRIILPSLGNTISDLWDLAFGQVRNQDIAWNSTEGLRLSPKLEGADAGYSYNPGEEISTIAGCINSIHDLMGMIIVDNINDPAAADYEHIYFIDNKYYQKYPLYTYTPITEDIFNTVSGVYYNNANNEYGAIGSIWNNEIGFVEGITSSLTVTSQFKELEGFAYSLNTIHGLILKINNILESEDVYSRDPNTVQGCINRLNDIFDKFNVLKPKHFLTVGNDGQIHSTNWTTAQTFEAIGQESAVVNDAKENRWIYFDLDANNHKFTIEHRFNEVSNTTSTIDLNNNIDTVDFYTPIVDNMGHIVGNNIETVTLPYGYKAIKTNGRSDEVTENATSNPVIEDIIADNTQDILNINSGNKWIRIDNNAEDDTLTIRHDVHEISHDDNTTNWTEQETDTTISVITYNHDEAGHLINTHTENYQLPFGYGKINSDEGTTAATATYDELTFTSDEWLTAKATNDTITYYHDYPKKIDDKVKTFDVNNNGDTIVLETLERDEKGHVISVTQNTVTLPYGYKTFNGDSGTTSADNTQDSINITGDNWINTLVENDSIKLSHKNPVIGTANAKNNDTPSFGSTFIIDDHYFDEKGHKFESKTHTVKIPKLSLSNGTGNVVTGLSLSPAIGTFTETKANLGTIQLGTFEKGDSSADISADITLQQALSRLENKISNEVINREQAIANLPVDILNTGSINGTVAFNNVDVAVKGLGTAAYTNANTYATFEQGQKADSALQNNTVFDYNDDKKTIAELFALVAELNIKVQKLEEQLNPKEEENETT